MTYTEIRRKKDGRKFYIGEEKGHKFLCGASKYAYKFLDLVKDFEDRFEVVKWQ